MIRVISINTMCIHLIIKLINIKVFEMLKMELVDDLSRMITAVSSLSWLYCKTEQIVHTLHLLLFQKNRD